jgi:hypothetical protein
LKFHLTLALHVAEEFNGGHLTTLSLEAQQRYRDNRQQDESDQKILNHSRKAP